MVKIIQSNLVYSAEQDNCMLSSEGSSLEDPYGSKRQVASGKKA